MSDCDEKSLQQLSPRAPVEHTYQSFTSMRIRQEEGIENFDKSEELKKAVKESSKIAAQNAKFDNESNAILRGFDNAMLEHESTAVSQMQLLIERLTAIAENAYGGKSGRRKRQAVYDKVLFYLSENGIKDELNDFTRSLIYGMIDLSVDAHKKMLMKIYAEIKKLF